MIKKLIFPIVLLTVLAGSGIGTKGVYAATNTDPQTSLIQRFVSRFNLKDNDVKTVFEEARTERQKQMRNQYEQRLTQLVADKKITEAQKKLIVAKHDELQTNRGKEQTEMQAWADKNGIDLQYVMGGSFGGGRGGMGMGKGCGMKGGW